MMVWLHVLHVISAMIYVGGHVVENVLLYRPDAVGGRSQVFRAIRAGEPAINVAAPLMIITGVIMVIVDDGWSFTSPFVLIGIGAILTSVIIGIPILREMKNLESLMAEGGDSAEVGHRYRRMASAWTGLGVVYLAATWAMVFKP